jgi:hypothetical protein
MRQKMAQRQAMPRAGEYVFPGRSAVINEPAMSALLEATTDKNGDTVHGFRSSFSDWASMR